MIGVKGISKQEDSMATTNFQINKWTFNGQVVYICTEPCGNQLIFATIEDLLHSFEDQVESALPNNRKNGVARLTVTIEPVS